MDLAFTLAQVDGLILTQQAIDQGAGIFTRSHTQYLRHLKQQGFKTAADDGADVVEPYLALLKGLLDACGGPHACIVVEVGRRR